jgi:hypothetical protein
MLLKWARIVHVYLTLLALALLLFFGLTGFMLNHDDWFGFDEANSQESKGTVPTALLKGPDKLAIVELLRAEYGATGLVDSFDDKDEDAIRVAFKRPGRKFEAVIQRADGHTTITRESRGLTGVLADLHRGKSTGVAWALVIDTVCVVLVIIATTGLILWHSLRGRARHGLAVMCLGVVLVVTAYFVFVP